jgi:hypothetical protein
MSRGSSVTVASSPIDTYAHVMDELDHAPRLAAVDAIMQAPERPARGASGSDRIVGMMSASASCDTLSLDCGRGATMGPPACSAQSSPVVFRARCCRCLQGLIASWDDWRGQKVFLIRKRSQVRVLDRPLAGIQEFAAFAQWSGIWLRVVGAVWVLQGAIWGHRRLPVRRKSAPGFAPPSGRRGLRERRPPRTEGTGRRALEHSPRRSVARRGDIDHLAQARERPLLHDRGQSPGRLDRDDAPLEAAQLALGRQLHRR